jgi:AraC-like DNA-binding protein
VTGSPIYPLVRDHVAHVMTSAQQIIDSGAAVEVGAATTTLMRALIVSAANDAQRVRDAMHQALFDRIEAYILGRLRNPELSPAMIADANGVSVRQLYRIFESRGLSLEGTIIENRLLGARSALEADASPTITAVASGWGFGSPSFFADRFRRRFGMTPREWRAHARSATGTA